MDQQQIQKKSKKIKKSLNKETDSIEEAIQILSLAQYQFQRDASLFDVYRGEHHQLQGEE